MKKITLTQQAVQQLKDITKTEQKYRPRNNDTKKQNISVDKLMD